MRFSLVLVTALFAGFSGTAFADEQVRQLPEFDSIKSRSAFNIVIDAGQPQSVTIKGSEKFTSRIVTEVVDRELIISYKEKNSFRISDDMQVIIKISDLRKLKIEGAGLTKINNINNDNFSVAYEGAGMLVMTGKTKNLSLNAQGVGMIEAKNLIADQASVNVEGVGSVSVYAKDKLSASVQGIGSLTYYGKPKSLSKSVDGIGSIRAAD